MENIISANVENYPHPDDARASHSFAPFSITFVNLNKLFYEIVDVENLIFKNV